MFKKKYFIFVGRVTYSTSNMMFDNYNRHNIQYFDFHRGNLKKYF